MIKKENDTFIKKEKVNKKVLDLIITLLEDKEYYYDFKDVDIDTCFLDSILRSISDNLDTYDLFNLMQVIKDNKELLYELVYILHLINVNRHEFAIYKFAYCLVNGENKHLHNLFSDILDGLNTNDYNNDFFKNEIKKLILKICEVENE